MAQRQNRRPPHALSAAAPGVAVAAGVALFAIQSHPLMPVYRAILWKVVTGAQ
ncbi:DedA family inner membrane protein YabI [Cronobacter dublinensis 582]|nr:DedA family inner membrane protein YabI [Cronobacter dublinensis 582]